MKKHIPFSNGSDASVWLHNNCDYCKPKCPKKRNIYLSFVTGTINMATIEWISYVRISDTHVTLNNCLHKNKYVPPRRTKIDNTPKLF